MTGGVLGLTARDREQIAGASGVRVAARRRDDVRGDVGLGQDRLQLAQAIEGALGEEDGFFEAHGSGVRANQSGVFPPPLPSSKPPTRRPEINTTVPAVSLPLPQHSEVSLSQRPVAALLPIRVQMIVFMSWSRTGEVPPRD